MTARHLFALDQNFPTPIVDALADSIPEAELVPIASIDHRLARVDDDKVLHSLHADARPWAGLVTNDASMLNIVAVIAMLIHTKLTLVVADAAGHDPIRATGLLLTHLPWICEQVDPNTPQLWHLRASHKPHRDPWEEMKDLARKAGTTTSQLFRRHRLSAADLRVSPLRPAHP